MELHDNGPEKFGEDNSAALQSGADTAPAAGSGVTRVLTADAAGVVVLPAGTELGDIQVDGRDLIVIGEDGVRYVIPDGAIIVPQIVIGDVAIPPLNLAALLIGNEPQPAAGNPQSSGGDFASPVGPIQPAYGLGNLLPYTELNFPQPEQREIIPGLIDREPTTVIITPDNPAGAVDASASVSEAGLPGDRLNGNSESPGSNASSDSETTTGTIAFTSPDGLASITLNGVEITGVGQKFTTPYGELTITSMAPGAYGYSYTLFDNTNAVGTPADVFAVVVTDTDGDKAAADLRIAIIDDSPTARADTDSVAAGTYGPESGNVITAAGTTSSPAGADTLGADGAEVSKIASNNVPANTDTSFDSAGNLEVAGQYGTLLIKADGSYTYTRAAGTPGGVSDAFTYTLVDGDGSASTATLTIEIGDATPVITSVPPTGDFDAGTLVYESGLPGRPGEAPGTNEPAPSESTSGKVTFAGGDGPVTATINGVPVAPGAIVTVPGVGTLVVETFDPTTGELTYTFTLADNTSGDNTSATFDVVVTDVDGDSAPGTFVIAIQDDAPQAIDDTATQTVENAPVSVDVLANDIQGADSVQPSTVQLVDGTLSGTGTLVNNGDGTFTYTPGPGENGPVTFDYSITDGDGDSSTATVTIALIADSTPRVGDGQNLFVDEDGFAYANADDGQTNPTEVTGTNSLTDSGSVTVNFGGDVPTDLAASIVLLDNPAYDGQLKTLDGNPVTFAVESGALVGRDSGGAEVIRVTVTGAVAGSNPGEVVYTYATQLSQPLQHATTGIEDLATLSGVTFQVTDLDGDTASGNFSVSVLDDVPTAVDDGPYGVVEDGTSTISGDVLANDASGADTPKAFDGWSAGNAAEVADLGVYGTLSLNGDGSWSYVLDNSRAATQALTSGDLKTYTLDYTMTDADGDTSPATLTITITGSDDGASVTTAAATGPDNTVYEAGLVPDGSSAGDGSASDSGTFTVSATDGIATVTIGGQVYTLAQVQAFATTNGVIDTGEGTLTLTGYTGDAFGGTVSYSYALKATIDNDSKAGATGTAFDDSVTIAVAGLGGTSASDDLVVRIVDDVPTAVDDGPYGVVEDGTSTISGDVLANDASGADTPKAFDGWSAGNAAEVADLGVYGTLSLNGDGSWSYVLDNSRAATQALTSGDLKTYTLDYTMTDADGDTSPATLTITITGSDDGASVTTAAATGPDNTVYEAGLVPDGSSAGDGSASDSGTFTVSATDGIATVTIGGQVYTLAQVQAFATTNGVIDTGEGTLTLTGYTGDAFGGTVSYSYALKATIDNDSKAGATGTAFDDSVTIAVAGLGGTSASDDLVVRIVDDVPTAVDDGPYGVVEDGTSTISGDVLANDASGADTPKAFDGWSAGNAAEVADLGVYGTLSLNGDGSWSYVLDNSRAATQALTSGDLKTYTLDYTMTDADGDTSPATLTITITGSDDGASVTTAAATGPDNTVYEAGLVPDGSSAGDGSASDSGTFTVSATDGIATVTIGGQVYTLAQVQAFATTNGVIDTGEGTLTLTGYTGDAFGGTVSYSYALKATIDNDSKAGATGTAFDDSVTIAVAGLGGTSASDDLVVRIVDDVPTAVDDGPYGVVEDGTSTISGDVLANDASGADTPKAFDGWSAGNAAEVADLGVYGTLSLNGDGSWSYVLDNSRAATQALTSGDLKTYTLDYTMTDADGDTSPATLTITITGSDDGASVTTAAATGPDNTVYEAGLVPDGSSAGDGSASDSGTFTVSATDGIATVTIGGQVYTLAQVQAFATTNGVIDTGEGTLTLTGYTGDAFGGTVSYSYALKATIDNDSKAGATGTAFDDSVTIAVAGLGGTSASDDLVVRIVDDVPTAVDDGPYGVVEDGTSTISGDVLANDASGADTPKAFDGWSAGNAAEVADLGVYGTLSLNGDGSWSYVLDNSRAATQALTSGDLKTYTLDYTMTDADGDTSPATLTITITGSDDGASVTTAAATGPDNTVYEAGLVPDGSSAGDGSASDSGTFTVSATDGIATVTIGGQVYTLAQVQAFATTNGVIDTGEGTLTLTGYTGDAFGGTVSYSYALKATIDNDSKAGATGTAFDDSVTIAVAGLGGTSASDDLVVRIVDDVPTAVDDGPYGVVEDGTSTISGDVLANDASGADTPKAFDGWSAGNAAEVADLGVYGTLSLNGDGSWSYVLDNSRAATQALTSGDLKTYTLDYTMTDADGDTSPATLTITITGSDDAPTIGSATARVTDEAQLTGIQDGLGYPSNSDDQSSSKTATGQVTVTDPDSPSVTVTFGNAPSGMTVDGVAVDWSGVGTNTLTGTVTINSVVIPVMSIVIDNSGNYSVTLSHAIDHPYQGITPSGALGGGEDTTAFNLTLNVSDGTASNSGTLTIVVEDDSPRIISSTNATLSGTTTPTASGTFSYGIGGDVHEALNTGTGNHDLTVSFSGSVGSSAITSTVATIISASSSTEVFHVEFDYDKDPLSSTNPLTHETGTLTFYKVADGTHTAGSYELVLDQPIQSYSTDSVQGAGPSAYTFNGGSGGASQYDSANVMIADNFYIQLTGDVGNNTKPFQTEGDGTTGTFASGDIFVGADSWVSISSTDIAAGGNSLQNKNVMDFNFYATNPGTTTNQPGTAAATGAYVIIDQMISSEDLVVVLKTAQVDSNGAIIPGTYTTTPIVLNYNDLFTAATKPAAYSDVTLTGNQLLLVVEQGDYAGLVPAGSELVGLQIVTSVEGITGTYYNFDGAIGTSTTPTAITAGEFASLTDNDVIKIVDVGVVRQTTSTQTLHLDFSVVVTDADGDQTAATHILINPETPPIVLDLNGDGAQFLATSAGVAYDYGDGNAVTAWVDPGDGILVHDANGSGSADNSSEFVFGGNGLTDLEGLAAQFDSNHDGVLDARDSEFAKFGVWQDANSNGVADSGEFHSLSELGIVSIALTSDNQSYIAAGGDVSVAGSTTFTRLDGSTGTVADAAFATEVKSVQRTAEILTTVALAGVAVNAMPVAAQPAAPALEHNSAQVPFQPIEDSKIWPVVMPSEPEHDRPALVDADSYENSPQPEAAQHISGETSDARFIANDSAFDHVAQASASIDAESGPKIAQVSADLFTDAGAQGTMQALLSLAPEASSTECSPTAAAQAAIANAMSDFKGETMVNTIIEHFAADVGHGADGAVTTDAAHLEPTPFMLMQGIGGAGAEFAAMIHLPDAHDDASMLAAAQA